MGFLSNFLFSEKKYKPLLIHLPYQMIYALETVVFLDNADAKEWEKIDRDYVVGVAVAEYLQKRLVDRDTPKPLPEPEIEQTYTNGRRQARTY